jgi:nitroreductase
MNVLDLVMSRRSVRVYQDRLVPDKAVEDLIEAIRWAPSAGNLESRKFFFVFDPDRRRALAGAAGNRGLAARMKKLVKTVAGRDPLSAAPLVIVACLDRRIATRYGERGEQLYAIQDVAASLMNLMLVAHDRGLGTVWVGSFDEAVVVKVLNLPEHLRPVALVPVGYPGQVPAPPPRAPQEQTIQFVR